MISPCINDCRLNKETKRCIGCDRTLEEIAEYGQAAKRAKAMTSTRTHEIVHMMAEEDYSFYCESCSGSGLEGFSDECNPDELPTCSQCGGEG